MPTHTHYVTIQATFGSAFQRDASLRILKGILEMWKAQVEARHAANKVEITFEKDDGT